MTDGCGSVMYGRTSGKRALYTCGRYMRTAGAECENNQIDAEALNRLVLSCLRQCAASGMQRPRLTELLKKRAAESEAGRSKEASTVEELAHLARVRHGLNESRETVGRRMAKEADDDLCRIMRSEFERLTAELRAVDQRIAVLRQKDQRPVDPQGDVDAALRILEHLDQVVQHPAARDALRKLVARLGMRVGLKFDAAVKGKVRKVRRLVGGLIVFGDRELPVPLHGSDRLDPEGTPPKSHHGHDRCVVIEKAKKFSRREMSGADPSGSAPTSVKQNESHREGVSSTKVSRGDRI
jgi:hypothetical protein